MENHRMLKKGCAILAALGLIALVLAGWVVSKYNGLVTLNEESDKGWAQVQNVLQRRADLIPNLVETVKGYAAHEKEIFEQVAAARSRLAGATTPADAATANAAMSSALSRLLAIAEAYPDLKANANFIRLQDELAGTENRIATERRDFNEIVRNYNVALKRFPVNVIAGAFGFKERDYFEAAAGAQEVPKVKF
ncbi:MAG: LemA family protein [Acidobacteria bacterium]|nr:LemA family protein [Acidobacteriota bacterium]